MVSWTNPNGSDTLLDYVLCPQEWATAPRISNCPSLEDAHAAIDHEPIRASFELQVEACALRDRRSLNADAWYTPDGLAAVEQAFNTLPVIPWSVDSTSHVQAIYDHINETLFALLSPTPRKPRNPAYSEATIAIVRDKRRARKRVRELDAIERRSALGHVHCL